MTTTTMFDPFEKRSAGWALAPEICALVEGKLDPDHAQRVLFAVAEDVRSKLYSFYCKPIVMERPPSLPIDDQELALRLARAYSAKRQTGEDLEVLNDFGEWRLAVWNAESDGEARIEVLFNTLRSYRAIIDANLQSGVEPFFDEVVAFLASEWGITVADHVPTYWEARRIARRASRREDVLPGWLAEGRDAPRRLRRDTDAPPERIDTGWVTRSRAARDAEEEERRDDDDE